MSWHTPQADAQLPLGQSSFTAFASNKPSSSTPAPAPSPPLLKMIDIKLSYSSSTELILQIQELLLR